MVNVSIFSLLELQVDRERLIRSWGFIDIVFIVISSCWMLVFLSLLDCVFGHLTYEVFEAAVWVPVFAPVMHGRRGGRGRLGGLARLSTRREENATNIT